MTKHAPLSCLRTRAIVAFFILLAGMESSYPASAAELLVVGRENCAYCKAWEIEVGRVYERTEEARVAPLRRVHIDDVPALNYDLAERVIYTPTFILLERGREVGRIIGYADEATFWGSLGALLRESRSGTLRATEIRRLCGDPEAARAGA
jgi:hypothetical protein